MRRFSVGRRRSDTPEDSAATRAKHKYPRNWGSIRKKVLARDSHSCANCDHQNHRIKIWDYRSLDVHHIVPLSKGGTNRLSNLVVLCRQCHALLEPHVYNLPESHGSWWKRLLGGT